MKKKKHRQNKKPNDILNNDLDPINQEKQEAIENLEPIMKSKNEPLENETNKNNQDENLNSTENLESNDLVNEPLDETANEDFEIKKEKFYRKLKFFIDDLTNLSEGTDIDATTIGIKKDIAFRGPTAWILVFSILIASIGLNANSTAVIIGAMLISPLMGPIIGLGFSLATFDFDTLKRSIKNFSIAVSLSLITSTLYFLITPLDVEQTELVARTTPTILDVLIALFGGFAGIIAGSRKEKTNVIPGVAIATALMPPLCTAGYGLATFKLEFFFGAFYLFFINSVFISLSTYLVVRYLKFPEKTYLDPLVVKKYKKYMLAFLIITIIPSTVIFYKVIVETRYNISVNQFISESTALPGSELINNKITFTDSVSYIDLYYIGRKLDSLDKETLTTNLDRYQLNTSGLFSLSNKTEIRIHQAGSNGEELTSQLSKMNQEIRTGIIEDIYKKNEKLILDKDQRIRMLEDEVFALKSVDTLPVYQISKEINALYEEIDEISMNKLYSSEFTDSTLVIDTNYAFILRFNIKNKRAKEKIKSDLKKFLNVKLGSDKIKILEEFK